MCVVLGAVDAQVAARVSSSEERVSTKSLGVSYLLLRHRANAGGQRMPCTALRAVLAVGGLWLLVYQPRQVFGPQVLLLPGAAQLEREIVRQTLPRATL